jgi:uncharacterized protein YaiL (DUF2058 family)
MSESLRDQLLKSGLAKTLKPEAKPVPKAPPPKHHHHNQQQHARPPRPPSQQPRPQQPRPQHARSEEQRKKDDVDLARAYAMRAKAEREERERAQREVERIAREKKERKAKLTTLLDGKALNHADADVARHFPHGNKIRRVYCTKEQLEVLNKGELAIVQLAGRYLIVDKEIGLQAQAIQPEALVLLCDPNAPADDDVPADLVW